MEKLPEEEGPPPGPPRSPYRSPKLRRLGSIADLTKGTGTGPFAPGEVDPLLEQLRSGRRD